MLYNGQPIVNFTDASAEIYARFGRSGNLSNPSFDGSTGTYSISNVPPGTYRVSLKFDAADPFDGRWAIPGDFVSYNSVLVNEGDSVVIRDLEVQRVIHLTSPVDNMGVGHATDALPTYAAERLSLACDPIPEATSYSLTIRKYEEPFTFLEQTWTGETSDMVVVPALPGNVDTQFYSLNLSAYSSTGLFVGRLMVAYTNGFGSDYRFRVGSQ